MQWLAPVTSCGNTFHIVSGAGAKARRFGNPKRNLTYWQGDEVLGFFYIQIVGDEFRGSAYQLNENGDYRLTHQQTIIRYGADASQRLKIKAQ